MAAIRMPGTLCVIWLVSPWPMHPAPIMPPRLVLPCSSLAFNAVSTMIIVPSRHHFALHFCLDLRERLPRRVLGRDDCNLQRPDELEPGVEGRQAALRAGGVELAYLVAGLRPVLERLIAVREPLPHVEGPVVVGAQLHRDGCQEGRALRPQIHDDVEDGSPRGAHQLGLGVRRELEVHPPHGPLAFVEGDVALRDHRLETVLGELLLTEGAREEPPVVVAPLEIEDEGAFELRFREDHALLSAFGAAAGSEIQRRSGPRLPIAISSLIWSIRR